MASAPSIVLIASNDVAVRDAASRYFSAKGLSCQAIDFDEKLLTQVEKRRPAVLLAGLSLSGPHLPPDDVDLAFSFLIALRHKVPGLPVFTIHPSADGGVAEYSKKLGFNGHLCSELDLKKILPAVRAARRHRRIKQAARSRRVTAAAGQPAPTLAFTQKAHALTSGLMVAVAAQNEKVSLAGIRPLPSDWWSPELRGRPANKKAKQNEFFNHEEH